jgi:hypothetical protein
LRDDVTVVIGNGGMGRAELVGSDQWLVNQLIAESPAARVGTAEEVAALTASVPAQP